MRVRGLPGLAAGLTLATACGFPGKWQGETSDGVTLFTDEGITACAGVLPRLVKLQERIADELGVDPAPVEYYFTDDSEKVRELCRRSVPGCAFPWEGRILYSNEDVVSSHELAHVVANRGLDPVPLTSEGLAMYFSSRRVAPLRLDVLPALNDPLSQDTAGAFVSYLIQTYGMDELFAFHQSTTSCACSRNAFRPRSPSSKRPWTETPPRSRHRSTPAMCRSSSQRATASSGASTARTTPWASEVGHTRKTSCTWMSPRTACD
jgi:hypothetical protein